MTIWIKSPDAKRIIQAVDISIEMHDSSYKIRGEQGYAVVVTSAAGTTLLQHYYSLEYAMKVFDEIKVSIGSGRNFYRLPKQILDQ